MSPSHDDLVALPGDPVPRLAAADRAAALGWPSPEAEDWRYSRIDEIDLDRFCPVLSVPDHDAGPTPEGEWAAEVVLVDGWVVRSESRHPAVTLSIGDDPALGSVLGDAPDATVEWARALAATPVVVRVERGAAVAEPILVRSVGVASRGVGGTHLVVVVEEGASASVVEVQSSVEGERLTLPLVELDVADRASLTHSTVQDLDRATGQIATQVARVGQDASLTSGAVALGGDHTRLRTDCRLEGRGASGTLLAAYFGEDDQTLDFRTFQDHRAPDTHSELLFKGALGGRSRSIYTGLITVRPDARGTNAFQTNRNLKLSEEAWAESVPNLEIQNNDVQCSHASAVGPVDEDQRFYLESRGVPPEVAERLVVAGFFAEVLDRLPLPVALSATLRAGVDERLERNAAVEVSA